METITTTYSMWSSFRDCRKACELRYKRELKPLETAPALYFGAIIHECLEWWHKGGNIKGILGYLDTAYSNVQDDPKMKADGHLAHVMMQAYANKYPTESWDVHSLETVFEAPIRNPKTGRISRRFKIAGKVDGIVKKKNGEYWLLEHKTAAKVDGGYLEKLWSDFQITLYSHYIEEALGLHITGVIYNILGKTKLQQTIGETQAEFEERKWELIEKSKTGKTSAKRRIPESNEAYRERLLNHYEAKNLLFREELIISQDQFESVQADLWDLTQNYIVADRNDFFYRNTGNCFKWGRPCQYWKICSNHESPLVIENEYKKIAPHEELMVKAF